MLKPIGGSLISILVSNQARIDLRVGARNKAVLYISKIVRSS